MAFEELTKPPKGLNIWIWRLLININWARTLGWSNQNIEGTKRETYIFSIYLSQYENPERTSAICLIAGPLRIAAGWAD